MILAMKKMTKFCLMGQRREGETDRATYNPEDGN